MKRGLQITFFQKLLITYLVALLLPVIIMGQQTLMDYQKAFEQEILQINANMLDEISAVVNLKMRELETIAVNLDVNPVLRPYEVSSTPYGAVRAIQALAQYCSTNSFIYELGYYIRGGNYIYTSIAAYEKQSFFKYFFRQSGYDSSELIKLLEDCNLPTILPSRQTEFLNKQVRLLVCLYPLPIQGGHYATAIFFIDENQISNLVKSIFQRMDGSVIIYNSEGQPLMALPNNTQVPDFSWITSVMLTPKEQEDEPSSAILNLNGERTAVTYIRSGYRSFSYLSLTSLQQIMAPAQKLRQRFFFTLGIVFIGGCLIILGSMIVTYKPLQTLFLKAKKAQTVVGPTTDVRNEIAFIDEILERVQQDNRLMQRTLQGNQHDTRLVFLIDLLNGMIADTVTLKQRSSLVGVVIADRAISVIMLLPEEPSPTFDKSLLAEVEKQMSSICGFYPLITVGERTVPVLLTLPEPAQQSIDRCIDEIYRFFAQRQVVVTIGVGLLYADPLQAPASFQQAMDALSHRFIRGKGSVIPFEGLMQKNNQFPWYPKQETDTLIRSITVGNAQGIRQSINSVLAQIQEQNLSIFAARCLCYDLINTVAKVVISYNVSLGVLEHQLKNMIRLPQTETIQQLSEYLIDFCTKLSNHLTSLGNARVEQILAYIDQHYRSYNFSVYSMAEALGISYSYMNRLFHTHTNQSVLEYLTNKRMELIKELLRTTDLPIKEVILSAGYNDIPNCSRKFKQREGISLRQYRERTRKS